MKLKFIITVCAILLLTESCQESKRARIEREAREFTEKNCPRAEFEDIIYLDSLVCHDDTCNNYIYYYSVKADSLMESDMKSNYDQLRSTLLSGIRNSVDLRYIKDEGLNITYTYCNAETHQTIIECSFAPEEYR